MRFLCEAKPASRPGRLLAYHAVSGGFMLGEIVNRVTGKTIREVPAALITSGKAILYPELPRFYGVMQTIASAAPKR